MCFKIVVQKFLFEFFVFIWIRTHLAHRSVMKKAIELPLSTQPESESPYFIVEGTKIGIPEHFHRYSELVANFSSANPESMYISTLFLFNE